MPKLPNEIANSFAIICKSHGFCLSAEEIQERLAEPMPSAMYTPKEAMHLLGISRRTLHKWLSEGTLEHIKIGQVIRIPKESILEYKKRRKK